MKEIIELASAAGTAEPSAKSRRERICRFFAPYWTPRTQQKPLGGRSQIQKGADSAFSAPFWTPRTQQKALGDRCQIQKGADSALSAPFRTIGREQAKKQSPAKGGKAKEPPYLPLNLSTTILHRSRSNSSGS